MDERPGEVRKIINQERKETSRMLERKGAIFELVGALKCYNDNLDYNLNNNDVPNYVEIECDRLLAIHYNNVVNPYQRMVNNAGRELMLVREYAQIFINKVLPKVKLSEYEFIKTLSEDLFKVYMEKLDHVLSEYLDSVEIKSITPKRSFDTIQYYLICDVYYGKITLTNITLK